MSGFPSVNVNVNRPLPPVPTAKSPTLTPPPTTKTDGDSSGISVNQDAPSKVSQQGGQQQIIVTRKLVVPKKPTKTDDGSSSSVTTGKASRRNGVSVKKTQQGQKSLQVKMPGRFIGPVRTGKGVFGSIETRLKSGALTHPSLKPEDRLKAANDILRDLNSVMQLSAKEKDNTTLAKAGSLGRLVSSLKEQLEASLKEPGLHDLNTKFSQKGLGTALRSPMKALKSGDPTQMDKAVSDLGKKLAREVDLSRPGVVDKFGSSQGVAFKSALLEAMSKGETRADRQRLGFGTSYEKCSPQLQKLADEVYAQMVSELTGNEKEGPDGMKLGKEHFQPELTGKAKKDDPVAKGGALLGQGGFGKVHLLKEKTSGEPIAVKEVTGKQGFEASATELRNHEQALGPGKQHDNVVTLKGTVHTGDKLLIGLEYCEGGTVHDLEENLRQVGTGLVTDSTGQKTPLSVPPDQRKKALQLVRATHILDAAKGLQHIHSNDIAHIDFKSPNTFIGKGGVSKVADLGNAIPMTGGKCTLNSENYRLIPDNPRWTAPELLIASKNGPWMKAGPVEKGLGGILKSLQQFQSKARPKDDPNFSFKAIDDAMAKTNNPAFIAAWNKNRPPSPVDLDDIETLDAAIEKTCEETGQYQLRDAWKSIRPSSPFSLGDLDDAVKATGDKEVMDAYAQLRPHLKQTAKFIKDIVTTPGFTGFTPAQSEYISTHLTGPIEMFRDGVLAPFRTGSSVTVDGGAADVWSLGRTAMESFYGVEVFSDSFGSVYGENLIAYADPKRTDTISDVRKAEWAKANNRPVSEAPSNPLLDSLLDGMMHRDPSKRLTAQQVANHPFFTSQQNVGSPEVRNLLTVLTTPGSDATAVGNAMKLVK